MKTKCAHLAMAALAATSLLVTTASASFSGAIYTSLADGETVNANNFEHCPDVYLNGGPQNLTGSGIPDGIYLFEVTDPSTSSLLSTDPAKNRQVKVINGRIYGTPGQVSLDGPADVYVAPLFGATDADMHMLGSYNAVNQSIPVQLWEFSETTNNGGVYKVTLYSVAGGASPDPENEMAILSPGGNSKSDNFRCDHEPGGPGQFEVIVFGRKYYDANANGVYDGGEEWTTADGRPPVTINLTFAGGPATAETDADGLWFHLFEVPEGTTLDFTACEEVPTDYNQTGPLDGDSVSNAEASATAAAGCWSGTITHLLGLSGLNFGNVDTVTIGGVKFYDANLNGLNDDGIPIEGFKIVLEITYPDTTVDTVEVYTAADGSWSYELPVGSSVTVCEEMPPGSWVQTAPESICYAFTANEDTSDLDFGNVCLGPGGGRTLGFWSNRNGKATMETYGMDAALAGLSALNLRNADGSHFNPTSYNQFRTWILNATATNMANMLSAQLAAMWLNTHAGWVSGGSFVYNPCTGFITVNDLMDDANISLGTYGDTTSPHAERSNQECLKNTLDDANNNLNFVQDQPCDVEYPPEA